MLLSWIIRTIPRSPRAFLALLVMLGSTALLFSALQDMFTPFGSPKTEVALKFTVGLVIGIPSTAVFYWFQSVDSGKRHQQNELDVLNRAMEADKRNRIYKQSTARPVFTSSGGAVNDGSQTGAQSLPRQDTQGQDK